MINADRPIQLDVVVPVHNEQETIEQTYDRLSRVGGEARGDRRIRIIFVDDGSTDGGWAVLRRIAEADRSIRAIRLSRRFGYQVATVAGLAHSAGDFSLVLGADADDPLECIPEMLGLAGEGYDVVYGRRTRRAGRAIFGKVARTVFCRLLSVLGTVRIDRDAGDFRLVSRRARELFLQLSEKSRFDRALSAWTGLRQTSACCDRAIRHVRTHKTNLKRTCRLAANGLFNSGAWPVALVGVLATLLLLCSLLALVCGRYAVFGVLVSGAVVVYGSTIVGVYVARLYFNVRSRPGYLIAEIIDPCGDGGDGPVQEDVTTAF